MDLVSVIVPVYKVEKYLGECVTSIRKQTYGNLEIILVDDGSPDQCGRMCDQYAQEDDRILVIHKNNGGLGDARNVGAEAATGKYVLFVDSDDRIQEELIQKTVQNAEEKDADVVIFDYAGVRPGETEGELFSFSLPSGQVISAETVPGLLICSCSAVNKLYRRSFWEKYHFQFPKGRYYEDLGTIPKVMALAGRVVYRKEVLYYYTMRDGSIMHSSDFVRNYRDRTWALDHVILFYRKQGLYERYKKELEYLVLENGYFIPSKEIILNDRRNPYLKRFREYACERFPKLNANPYIKEFSGKDRLLWLLLRKRMYFVMVFLSYVGRVKENVWRKLIWKKY